MYFFLASLILVVLSDSSLGFPGGAPGGKCVSLDPKVGGEPPTHGDVTAQTTPVPYNLTIDKDSVGQGDTIKVTLQKGSGAGFNGFLLVVVSATDTTNKPFGEFNATGDAKNLECVKEIGGGFAATHTNNVTKTATTVTWKAPADAPVGDYLIRWTVVQDIAVFWVNAPTVKFKIVEGDGGVSEPGAATDIYFNPWLSTSAVALLYALSAWC